MDDLPRWQASAPSGFSLGDWARYWGILVSGNAIGGACRSAGRWFLRSAQAAERQKVGDRLFYILVAGKLLGLQLSNLRFDLGQVKAGRDMD